MEIVLNLKSLKQKSLTPNQVVLLKLLYDKNFDDIKEIFGIKEAIAIRDSLIGSKYILNPEGSLVKFTETLIRIKMSKSYLALGLIILIFLSFITTILFVLAVGFLELLARIHKWRKNMKRNTYSK